MMNQKGSVALVFLSGEIGGAEIATVNLIKQDSFSSIDVYYPEGFQDRYFNLFSTTNAAINYIKQPHIESNCGLIGRLSSIYKIRKNIISRTPREAKVILVGVDASAINLIPGESRFIPYIHEYIDNMSVKRKIATLISIINSKIVLAPVSNVGKKFKNIYSKKLIKISNYKKDNLVFTDSLRHADIKTKIIIGLVGRIEINKNQLFAVKLCESLNLRGIQTELIFAGAISDELYFMKIVNYAALKSVSVKFERHEYSQMNKFYSKCNFILIASRTELIPNTIFEALNNGRLIISNDTGAISEYLPRSMLFDLNKGEKFAAQIIVNLLKKSELDQREIFKTCFNMAREKLDNFSLGEVLNVKEHYRQPYLTSI